MRICLSLILTLWLGLGAAVAQSVADLAPPDALLSLSMTSDGKLFDTLQADLEAFDWGGAAGTLEQLFGALAGQTDDPDLRDLLLMYRELLANPGDPAAMAGPMLELCPDYERVMEGFRVYDMADYSFEGIITLSVSPFNPLPAVTAIAQVDPAAGVLYEDMREVLFDCFLEDEGVMVSELEQDGVTLYVVGDAGDFPVILGSTSDLFFLGTNPDVIRSVVRKAMGSSEPALSDTALYQASSSFEALSHGYGLSLDFTALADTLEGFAGFLIDGPETEYLLTRLSAALRTLGGYSGRIGATAEGLQVESLLAVNPEGGDRALAELLLCERCRVSSPFLAPEGSVSVSAAHVPLRGIFAYAQDWLDGLEPIVGEDLDIKMLLGEELGFDLDRALLGWIGEDWQAYTLEPTSTDISTLLYQPAQALVIPVSSPEAAQVGLEELETVLLPGLLALMSELDDMGDMNDILTFSESMIAVRETSYQGVPIRRLQYSFNADIAYTFLGNYLVIGTPLKATERMIDSFQGARGLMGSESYQQARAGWPDALSAYSYSDTTTQLRALANLSEVFSQPLAFGIAVGLQAALDAASSDFGSDMGSFDLGFADTFGLEPEVVDGTTSLSGELTPQDSNNEGTYADYLDLSDVVPGSEVTIELLSDDFDTYLYLIDQSQSIYVDSNDDAPDTSRSELSFTVQADARYWVELGSYGGFEEGAYQVNVTVTPGSAPTNETQDALPATDPPDFAQLLGLVETLPQLLYVLADHTDHAEAFVTSGDGQVYRKARLHFRW